MKGNEKKIFISHLIKKNQNRQINISPLLALLSLSLPPSLPPAKPTMEDAEAVVANVWALMASWSTPTVFFCVLNLIVAILFFTSKKPLKTHHNNQHPSPPQSEEANQQQHNHQYPPPQQLVRAPSLLQRLRSFEFSLYRSEEHPDQSQTQTQIQTRQPDPPQEQAPILDRQVTRSKSDNSGGGEAPRRPPVGKMKKWKSEQVRVEEEEEEEREGVRERERETASYGGGVEDEEEGEVEGEGVDAQADDFIDRFKKQLKLQRVDSILRYTDMLKRGLGRSQV
ncbi:Pathogen-associated molecular patterns-induced protein A70 [Camellia lanceoleosa]|uniref:Pathogen-associated molecular patterns-induced protein A70 n=1 Tax=Camellia lanceoleosa TaxID=1840588 RepID=A0ACC0IDP5_9ERIC|nr:Pathogen-associated molecular patterns-induced protein A70 [Camellia lanceoleosa]